MRTSSVRVYKVHSGYHKQPYLFIPRTEVGKHIESARRPKSKRLQLSLLFLFMFLLFVLFFEVAKIISK